MVRKNIKIVDVVQTEEAKEEVIIEQDTSPEEGVRSEPEPIKTEPVKPLKERKKRALPDNCSATATTSTS